MKQYYKPGEICPGLGSTCEGRCRWDAEKGAYECARFKDLKMLSPDLRAKSGRAKNGVIRG